jgi:hypothetical protein
LNHEFEDYITRTTLSTDSVAIAKRTKEYSYLCDKQTRKFLKLFMSDGEILSKTHLVTTYQHRSNCIAITPFSITALNTTDKVNSLNELLENLKAVERVFLILDSKTEAREVSNRIDNIMSNLDDPTAFSFKCLIY